MKIQFLLIATLIVASAALPAADSKSNPPNNAEAAFARLKTLVGEWEATTNSGKVHLSYELVSGDTALLERESSETMPSMVTVYYVDGGRLLLTHYCMAGNQPRMQAKAFNAGHRRARIFSSWMPPIWPAPASGTCTMPSFVSWIIAT